MNEPPPRPDEARALARLAVRESRGATSAIERVHSAIAARSFRAVGRRGRPVQLAHDAISTAVYATVRGGIGLAGRAADAGLARRSVPDRGGLSTRRAAPRWSAPSTA